MKTSEQIGGDNPPIRRKDQYIDIETGQVYFKKDLDSFAYHVTAKRWVTVEGKKRNYLYLIYEIKIIARQQELF